MSAALLRALEPEAEPGNEACAAISARATARIRRRRRLRLAGYAAASAGLLTIAGAVAVVGGSEPGDDQAGAGADTPAAQASQPGTGVIYAEELLSGAASRIRVSDSAPDRQAAVACRETTEPDSAAPCRALWVGDLPLLAVDPDETLMTLHATDHLVRVDIRWTVRNVGYRPLLLDRGDLMVGLVTDPDRVTEATTVADETYRGVSLWADDRERLALNLDRSSLERLEPGSAMRGWATFTAEAPAADTAADPLWDLAAGATAGTLTVQVGIPHSRQADPLTADVIAEASMTVDEFAHAIAADHLTASFRPRERGEAAGAGRQAALLCDVPKGMRSSTFENYNIPYQARQVACDPGWVDGLVLADTGTSELRAGTPADTLVWDVTNVSGQTVQLSRLQVLIEPDPDGLRARGDGLTLLGTAVVTPSSAWLVNGRRTAWLTNVFYDYPLLAGATIGGRDRLFPGMLSSDTIVDVDEIVGSLADGGRATAIAAVPFLDDPSRVLLLETPLDPLITPALTASPSP
ncbi:hypothetical protein [Demequina maris]|uniref:hypothetical protein n=1 Tax=Demequina maris TaxID=1638982 RepID=UPI000782940C|nr:hypothetical protein [Demequina maris]